ncbi:glycosyltransferase family 2 protein [Shewanella halifaxensis]|uniref:glycosyltransferase family 2 protein n=1 Tax=Shewanella halifaxensis TaxID=271098 RepID=UPI000D598F64|nr:glycosyltransferase family 2 protein [Shewanella halifaxensis]
MENEPLITIVIPSYNQGHFLEHNLQSIFSQEFPVEVFVMDGGSDDSSIEVIKKYEHLLTGWRSHKDNGQSSAINEGIKLGRAPYVCWLNSDDFFYPNALKALFSELNNNTGAPFVYGKCWATDSSGNKLSKYLTVPFSPYLFANYCFVCQPGTLIKRTCWEQLGGLNEALHMAMDYELWWRLYTEFGRPVYSHKVIAATRAHNDAKTLNNIEAHYLESMNVVRNYWGTPPFKWFWALPVMKVIRRVEKALYKNG